MYSYDIDNNTFVCFIPHRENKYHGFDIPIEVVPDEIKNLFLK
jgi:hypothetical protein